VGDPPTRVVVQGDEHKVHEHKKGSDVPQLEVKEKDTHLLLGNICTYEYQHRHDPCRSPDKGGLAVVKGRKEVVGKQEKGATKDYSQEVDVYKPPGAKEIKENAGRVIKKQHIEENMPDPTVEKRVGDDGPGLAQELEKVLGKLKEAFQVPGLQLQQEFGQPEYNKHRHIDGNKLFSDVQPCKLIF
jgi:hypothetical protein